MMCPPPPAAVLCVMAGTGGIAAATWVRVSLSVAFFESSESDQMYTIFVFNYVLAYRYLLRATTRGAAHVPRALLQLTSRINLAPSIAAAIWYVAAAATTRSGATMTNMGVPARFPNVAKRCHRNGEPQAS